MKITATTTFLDGYDCYKEGKTYDVSDATGGYFIGNGWAEGPDGYQGPGVDQHVILDVQDSTLGQSSEVK